MAITKPVWTKNQTLRAAATIAAGATETHDLDLDDEGFDIVVLNINIAHGSASGVTIEALLSVDSGATFANVSLAGGFDTDGTDVIVPMIAMALPYLRISITNDDGSNATGNISITYAGRQWDTT